MSLRIRSLRQHRGWSLDTLAARAGIDRMTLDRIELGKTQPRLNTLTALARALGVDVTELFEREAPRKPRRSRR